MTLYDRRQVLADLALLLVTLIWGSTFVMVKDAVAGYPVFSFLAIRFAFASIALLPALVLQRASHRANGHSGWTSLPHAHPRFRLLLAAPVLIGLALFTGYSFQTLGLQLTTPAKAGFITGLSVVVVPVVAALVLRRSPPLNAWFGVVSATAGLALLTIQGGFRVEPGDLLVSGCALAFAAHILLTGRFAPAFNPLVLTLGQLIVVALFSAAAGLLVEAPPPLTGKVVFAAAFTGVLATSAAFSIQTLAQRFTTPTHTALIFAAEPVFAGLFSFLLIGEVLGPRQLAGCALILAGMVIGEIRPPLLRRAGSRLTAEARRTQERY